MNKTAQLQERLDFIGLNEAAKGRLAAVQGHIDKHLAVALDRF